MLGFYPFAGAPLADAGQANIAIAVTGVSASGQIGDVKTGISVQPSSFLLSASLGTVSAGTSYDAVVTGEQASTSLGSVTVYLQQIVYLTGIGVTASLGEVIPASDNIIDVTGFGLTASLGADEVVVADANAEVSGNYALGEVGTVEIDSKATVYLTGVSARGGVSTPLVWGIIDTTQNPNWVPIAA